VRGWLLDTNVVSELRKPRPDSRVVNFISAQPGETLFVTDVTLAHHAAISHHHGIGLNRSRFLPRALGSGFEVLRGLKTTFDPHGILNPGKFGLDSPFGPAPWA